MKGQLFRKIPATKIATALVLLVLFTIFGTGVYADAGALQTTAIARPVIIYQSSCGNPCAVLFNTTFPQLQAKYGDRIEMFLIDADLPANKQVIDRLLKEYNSSRDSLPQMLIEQTTLKGVQAISQQSDATIKASLDSGSSFSPLARDLAKQVEQLQSAVTVAKQSASQLTQQVNALESSLASAQRMNLILTGVSGLLFLSTLIAIIVAVIFVGRRSHSEQRRHPLLDTRGDEAAFIRTLIGQGKYKTDFLALMLGVSEQYQREGTVGPRAAQLARDFLMMARELLDLAPVENLGSWVNYDPSRHIAYGNFTPGAKVVVIEPGWQRHGNILKRASVQAKKES